MSENNQNVVYRCPVCFARENDVVLQKKDDGSFYCVKCSFFGSLEEINISYNHLREKYKNIVKRITLEDIKKL